MKWGDGCGSEWVYMWVYVNTYLLYLQKPEEGGNPSFLMRLASQQVPVSILYLQPQCWDYMATPSFLHRYDGFNSGSHACVQVLLATEPPFQHTIYILKENICSFMKTDL